MGVKARRGVGEVLEDFLSRMGVKRLIITLQTPQEKGVANLMAKGFRSLPSRQLLTLTITGITDPDSIEVSYRNILRGLKTKDR